MPGLAATKPGSSSSLIAALTNNDTVGPVVSPKKASNSFAKVAGELEGGFASVPSPGAKLPGVGEPGEPAPDAPNTPSDCGDTTFGLIEYECCTSTFEPGLPHNTTPPESPGPGDKVVYDAG